MKVSVIIPSYNVKPYLERCVKSVLCQTYKDLEVILVNDGSTDGTGELCDLIATWDPRVVVVHQKNQGLSVARNTGVQKATGEYIVFIDSDDEWLLEDGIETLLTQSPPNSDLIIFKNVDIWKNDRRTSVEDYDIENISCLSGAQVVFTYLVLTQRFRMSACFLLVRRQLLVDYDIYFPSGYISEDVQWSLHLWQHAHTVNIINLDFYGYYHRENTLSTTTTIRVYESYDKIFTFWKKECDKNCVNATMIRFYLANMWVSTGYSYYRLNEKDKPEALRILRKHTDLLQYSVSQKAKRVAVLVNTIGVKNTTFVLGVYWRLRNWVMGHVI
jgi:glycosyltransferase involved in cell wall biosynthesis